MRMALALGVLLAGALPVAAQTVLGVSLGAAIPEGMALPDDTQTQAPYTRRHWMDRDGLQLTAIADSETGEVHFIELRPATSAPVDAPIDGMRFGETTQADLHVQYGSEGVVFANIGRAGVFGDVAAFFTSYEIAGTADDVVISFTTIAPLDDVDDDAAARSVLDSIVVAQGAYLNQVWGLNRGRLPGYAPIPDPFRD